MGFYYISIFSIVPLGIAYGLLALIYWGVVRASRGTPARKTILSVVGAVFLVLPVGEELWIAWNFGQACKEAGTFIHRKVEVEGFYDDTRSTHAGPPTPQAVESFENSGYRFLEMKGRDDSFVRIEKIDGVWKPTVLDRPTARYHYKHADPMNGTRVSHNVGRSGTVIVDSTTNEEIARYTSFGREPPWFYIGLGIAPFACDAPGRWPNTKGNALVYRETLIPASKP